MSLVILEIHTEARHGFFSAFFGALRGIRVSEIKGYVPVVVWDSKSPYYDIQNGGNAWTQYFAAVSAPVPPSVVRRTIRKEFCGWDGIPCYDGMGVLETLCVVYHKYIRINPDVLADVPHLSPDTLGMHYRGTDKLSSKEFEAPPIQEVIDMLTRNSLYRDKAFFFATDDIDALTLMKRAFPDMMYNPSIRSSGTSVHRHYEYVSEDVTPTRDGPLKGRQVLVDALSLAKCNHIMRCPSGLSLFSILVSDQTWLDYTPHTWEAFLHGCPRDVKFYDVVDPRVEVVVNENTLWISNQYRPTNAHIKQLDSPSNREVYAIDEFHEFVHAGALFDQDTLNFAAQLIQSTMDINVVDVAKERILTSAKDFAIVCSREIWERLKSKVLIPLYNDQVFYNGRKAALSLKEIPRFSLLILTLCTRHIGVLSALES